MAKKNPFTGAAIESETIETLSKQLIETTNRLYRANEELTHIQKEREVMLANISHDLRAPITAIRGAVDLVNASPDMDADTLREYFRLVDRRTETLETMIQDMYLLFSVEDHSKELNFSIVDAAPFLEEYFFDIEADARYADKELILDVPEDLGVKVNLDVQKFVRVLDNLFTNAGKYSDAGAAITLHASLTEDNQLLIAVKDTGIGIPAESLPHIFDRTYTVSSSRTPGSVTGSGFGLAIVKATVERHGGSVTCESLEGTGSTFRILLPIV